MKELEAAEKIVGLSTQSRFPLVVNNVTICTYVADFTYSVLDDRGRVTRLVIEDVKGMETDVFKLKAKLFNALNETPLSIIYVKGEAKHSTRPRLSDKTGNPIRSRAGWMDLHWKGRIPD